MNDEKKPCGGVTPELSDAALDAVTGGTTNSWEEGQDIKSQTWADQAWDFMMKKFGADEDGEQQS